MYSSSDNEEKGKSHDRSYKGQSVEAPFENNSPPVNSEIMQAEEDPVGAMPERQADDKEYKCLSRYSCCKLVNTIISEGFTGHDSERNRNSGDKNQHWQDECDYDTTCAEQ